MSEQTRTSGVDDLAPELREVLEPLDEHNRRLIDNVHPLSWVNPSPADRYHLVVVGGGTAGLVSAAGAAGLGARVALIEKRLLGGDCLNYGCVPSKALISAARAWHAAQAPNPFGAPAAERAGDFGVVMERMRRLRADISRHDSARRFRGLGVDVFIGAGRFVASDALEVGGQRLRFRRAIVATGASPMVLPIPGLAQTEYLTNETVFSLTERPERLAIIGGGPIGCELAQAFARFGSRVSIFDIAPHVLVREDADAAEIVQQALLRDGVDLRLGTNIRSVERAAGETSISFETEKSNSQELRFDKLLLAVGRVANVEGIGLEAAGVAFSRHGVEVDDRLRTSNKRIFAVGDVATRFKFTHVADALARIAIQNALFFGRKKASDLVVPWCTYTDPEIAHVGMYEEDAEKAGIELQTLTIPLAEVDRSVLEARDEGFLRLHVQKGKDRILGATLVADHAGDMLGELSLAVTQQIGLGRIAATVHAYPTQAEVIKKAADTWRRGKLTPTVSKIFESFFKIIR